MSKSPLIVNFSSKDLEILRLILPETVPEATDKLVDRFMRLLIDSMNQLADEKIGPLEKRIGVYGRYTESSWKVIDEVMKKVSKLGFAAITGKGFYLPKIPRKFHPIGEIMSPTVKSELEEDRIRKTVFHEYFVLLAQKAISYLNEIGSQFDELRGCYKNRIPIMGFVIRRSIWRELPCPYLIPKNNYVECNVPRMALCSAQYIQRRFCPFHSSSSIPIALKELLFAEENRLIGIRKLRDIEPVLEEFLH